MENKKDIRLYEYVTGTLRKVGKGKTGTRPHIFDSIEKCESHIAHLRTRYKKVYKEEDDTQYLIIEYFGVFNSKIIKIV
jgi:hypothetical protein